MQLSLFDVRPELPDGFVYRPNFLGVDEEANLLHEFSGLNFKQFRWHEYTGNRRTVPFGWSYSFDDGTVSPSDSLPEFLRPLRAKLALWAEVSEASLVQGLVTEYRPGAGIGWHRDAPPFGIVLSVSLLSDCRFRLRLEKESINRELTVERRSVYALTGPARTLWQHGIPPAKETRYSITFRTLRGGPQSA